LPVLSLLVALLLLLGSALAAGAAEPDQLARREGIPLLHKPFDLDDLLRVIQATLAS